MFPSIQLFYTFLQLDQTSLNDMNIAFKGTKGVPQFTMLKYGFFWGQTWRLRIQDSSSLKKNLNPYRSSLLLLIKSLFAFFKKNRKKLKVQLSLSMQLNIRTIWFFLHRYLTTFFGVNSKMPYAVAMHQDLNQYKYYKHLIFLPKTRKMLCVSLSFC